jgi:LmbE family N-acetylglucosaminyl deacetylase
MLPAILGNGGTPLSILCLGAHCDDIEIGCGGTLLRLLADRPGSNVLWVAFASDSRREREARATAAEFLAGADQSEITIERFRDGYLPTQFAEVKEYFETIKRRASPDLILTHHRADRHQDHRTIAELTWNTFRNHVVLEYEIPKYEGDLGHPNLFVPLAAETARRKIALLMAGYPSQASRSWFRPETFEALMRLRGIECNAPEGYAEALHAPKLVI